MADDEAMRIASIIERVEAATGPDRDVDAAIAPIPGLRVVDEGHPLGRCCYDENGRLAALPRYTASLDAAMTLVPEGAGRMIETQQLNRPTKSGAWARVRITQVCGFTVGDEGHGATLPLALCAAALRCRAALQNEGTGDGQ